MKREPWPIDLKKVDDAELREPLPKLHSEATQKWT